MKTASKEKNTQQDHKKEKEKNCVCVFSSSLAFSMFVNVQYIGGMMVRDQH